jgi:2,3-bisphosphoglycerate-independent phosphoglycerate mutase
MILDGWGISPEHNGNAVYLSGTPILKRLMAEYPNTQLTCSGEAVGLPAGVMGNSEVGHLNIGAGRIVYQDLLRIDIAIREKRFFQNKAFDSVMSDVRSNGAALHLIGLVSDGGVHSHINHLLALLDMAREKGVSKVYVHAILDGRDTSPDSGAGFVGQVQEHIHQHGFGQIATVCGRYYAMDRDKRWDRNQKAYQLYTQGIGEPEKDPIIAIRNAYSRKETDEFVKPIVITGADSKPLGTFCDNDGVIFFNFRADRARQITRAFTDPKFREFGRNVVPNFCQFVCMTRYDETFDLPTAFPPFHLTNILGEVVSRHGLRQLRIAETEKYAHVTYFFNGGEEKAFPMEERCLIPSPRDVPTYDYKPDMSAREVAAEMLSRLKSRKYDMIVLNFANMDMVGHTGVLNAAIEACKVVDSLVDGIVREVMSQNGVVLITADHGNSEKMLDEAGHIHTAHTTNPVPFILADDQRKNALLRKDGILGDIAPTMLDLMGLPQPEEMTGRSLISS